MKKSRAWAIAVDCAGKSRDRSYASCLTAKPPMHHRRVLVWLWRLVAAGWKRRPFGPRADNPPLLNSAAKNALKMLVFMGGFGFDAFNPFSDSAWLLGHVFAAQP